MEGKLVICTQRTLCPVSRTLKDTLSFMPDDSVSYTPKDTVLHGPETLRSIPWSKQYTTRLMYLLNS